MVEVLDDLMVCIDCYVFIANGDLPEDEEAAAEVIKGVEATQGQGGYICPGDSEKEVEFTWRPCGCCGSSLGGSRHHCIVLSK